MFEIAVKRVEISGKFDEFLQWGEVFRFFFLLLSPVAVRVTSTYLRSFKYMVRRRKVQS